MNYYDILGVSRNATTKEITVAFKKLVKELHPDRYKTEEEKREAEKRFKEVTRAFNILKDPVKRREYDQTLRTPHSSAKENTSVNSEDFFKKAMAYFKKNDFENAETFFQAAINRGMATADCFYYLALSQINLPRRSKKVIENLEHAINLDPLNVKYRLQLADFFLNKGVKSQAVYHYKRVLKIDPNNKRAIEVLKALKVIKQKNFLGKLFGSLFKRG